MVIKTFLFQVFVIGNTWFDHRIRVDTIIPFICFEPGLTVMNTNGTIRVDPKPLHTFGVCNHVRFTDKHWTYAKGLLTHERTGIAGLQTMYDNCVVIREKGPTKVSPFWIPVTICNMASGLVSIRYGATGPNTCVVTACTSGTHAVGEAYRLIQRGDADAMICGGTEAPVNRMGIGGFSTMRALSTRNDDPERASRPFDAGRDGFVIGEAGAVLQLGPELHDHLVTELEAATTVAAGRGLPTVVACAPGLRPALGRIVRDAATGATVISYQEIGDHLQVDPIANIDMPALTAPPREDNDDRYAAVT